MTKDYKTNIEVLERAAQLLWTFEEKKAAGQLFLEVCKLPPGKLESYVKWSDACLLNAHFAEGGTVNKVDGLFSIERLIQFTTVNDDDSQNALTLRESLKKLLGK